MHPFGFHLVESEGASFTAPEYADPSLKPSSIHRRLGKRIWHSSWRRPAPTPVVQPMFETVAAVPAAVGSPQVEKWEYKQVFRSKHEGKSNVPVSHLLMESELNDAGNGGWELVAVAHVLVPANGGDREHALVATFKRLKKK